MRLNYVSRSFIKMRTRRMQIAWIPTVVLSKGALLPGQTRDPPTLRRDWGQKEYYKYVWILTQGGIKRYLGLTDRLRAMCVGSVAPQEFHSFRVGAIFQPHCWDY